MSSAGTFRDAQGRVVRVPPPSRTDEEAVAEFRSRLNKQLTPEVVLEWIRKHTALIAEVLRALGRHEVDCVLIGGLALALHGSNQLTFDIDLVPAAERANLDRLASAMRELRAKVSQGAFPSSPEIDRLYDEAIRTLDDKRRVELGQQIDQAIWNLMPQLPLYQSTGTYAVPTTLANFSARSFADVSYENIDYTK